MTFLGIGALGWTAIVGAAGLGYQVAAGEQQRRQGKAGIRDQRAAQQQIEDAMTRQRTDAAKASARAAKQQEQLNFNEIMAGEEELSRLSKSSTTLTSPSMRAPAKASNTLGGY